MQQESPRFQGLARRLVIIMMMLMMLMMRALDPQARGPLQSALHCNAGTPGASEPSATTGRARLQTRTWWSQ